MLKQTEPGGDCLDFDFSVTPEMQAAHALATRTTLQTIMLTAFQRDYGIDTAPADGLSGDGLDEWLWETQTAWIHQQLEGGRKCPE